jgi:uncharacterized protein YndB with AHSA1/START domain
VIRCEASVHIARSPAYVFAILDDLERTPLWLDRCVSIVQTSDGARGAGTRLRFRYRERGREGEIAGEVETYEPERRIVMKFTDRALDVRVAFELAPDGDGTKLAHAAEITPKMFIIKMLSPWIRSSTRRQMAEVVDKLRRLAETGSTQAAPTG